MSSYAEDLQACKEVAFLDVGKTGYIFELLGEFQSSDPNDPDNRGRATKIREQLNMVKDDVQEISGIVARHGRSLSDADLAGSISVIQTNVSNIAQRLMWLQTKKYLASDDFQKDLEKVKTILEIAKAVAEVVRG